MYNIIDNIRHSITPSKTTHIETIEYIDTSEKTIYKKIQGIFDYRNSGVNILDMLIDNILDNPTYNPIHKVMYNIRQPNIEVLDIETIHKIIDYINHKIVDKAIHNTTDNILDNTIYRIIH